MEEQIFMEKKSELKPAGQALEELQNTVARLRAPDGCPWDRIQTHESLKAACIEEAAEVICGINILALTGKTHSLLEELGDLLLQVMMHAQIAEEEGLFTLEDVIRGINTKMIRRHPHVFGVQDSSPKDSNCAGFFRTDSVPEGSIPTDSISNNSISADSSPKDPVSADCIPADWKKIKAAEKKGREWEEEYLFEAFEEAKNLIDVARERKAQSRLK